MTPDPLVAIEALIQAVMALPDTWCRFCRMAVKSPGIINPDPHAPTCLLVQADAALVELRAQQAEHLSQANFDDLHCKLSTTHADFSALRRDVQALVEALMDPNRREAHNHGYNKLCLLPDKFRVELEAVRLRLNPEGVKEQE